MANYNEKYTLEQFKNLVDIDSTTSQFRKISDYLIKEIKNLGFEPIETHKGGIIVNVGGEGNPLCVTAHVDDIGLMVRKINNDGTLNVCPVGGLYPLYCMEENVRVYTRDEKVYTGTICRTPNSIHVTEDEIRKNPSDYRTNVCVVLDEDVNNKEDTIKLGIETGDIVALEPRFTISNGYIKSRFIDDKAAAAILLAILKDVKENNVKLNRKVYFYFAMYEEIGHGTTYLPSDVKDIIAIDIAPTGPDQTSNEHRVSIFAKDSRFPYHYELTNELRDVAKEMKLDFALDIFTPHYGSDGDGSVMAGYDIRHGAIGPGTANSHGYERTHVDGLKNTYLLAFGYITK